MDGREGMSSFYLNRGLTGSGQNSGSGQNAGGGGGFRVPPPGFTTPSNPNIPPFFQSNFRANSSSGSQFQGEQNPPPNFQHNFNIGGAAGSVGGGSGGGGGSIATHGGPLESFVNKIRVSGINIGGGGGGSSGGGGGGGPVAAHGSGFDSIFKKKMESSVNIGGGSGGDGPIDAYGREDHSIFKKKRDSGFNIGGEVPMGTYEFRDESPFTKKREGGINIGSRVSGSEGPNVTYGAGNESNFKKKRETGFDIAGVGLGGSGGEGPIAAYGSGNESIFKRKRESGIDIGGGGAGGDNSLESTIATHEIGDESFAMKMRRSSINIDSGGGGSDGNGGGGEHPIGTGVEPIVKKKRGRPRKYAPDGSHMALGQPLMAPPVAPPQGASPDSITPTPKKNRGRPPGSGRKQRLANVGEWMHKSAGFAYTPHVLLVTAGEDVAEKILSFAQQRPRALCVMSANGSVSAVTVRQDDAPDGTFTYEGEFEILCLSGSYLIAETGGPHNRTGGISISFCSADGHVIGGQIGGRLIASGLVQVVVSSFAYEGDDSKGKTNVEAPSNDEKVES